ncbi:helix-turn-helix transcriptional regulator [Actinomadura sp. 7K507]|uniref:helix-turn-helix domain-containing protein n=1 Tax=Actinomadura sp. 7K507 TaxID=2530365 RepID=UPI001051EEBC|nr:helix-turn-helix transcriptional regulator [Actinomadura sp. 7K507]TDC74478.1 XRE family transcriptional regulator [Actinomadura sp. 7K507]
MSEATLSTTRRRKIGRVLRHLREESGYTLKTAGKHLERSPSSLSQIENGVQWLRLRDLGFILDRYNVPTDLRAAMMTLAEQDRQPGWWDDYKDLVTPEALDRVSLEHDASRIITTETTFIPGLLQTESYARAVNTTRVPVRPDNIVERYVRFRLARQEVLRRNSPTLLQVVLDEAVLRRPRGGRQVMRSQLRRLLNDSEQEHMLLQVLPLAVDPGPAYVGQFQLIEIGSPSILRAILIDHFTGQWILEDEAEASQYHEKFTALRSSALDEPTSRDLINRIISEL